MCNIFLQFFACVWFLFVILSPQFFPVRLRIYYWYTAHYCYYTLNVVRSSVRKIIWQSSVNTQLFTYMKKKLLFFRFSFVVVVVFTWFFFLVVLFFIQVPLVYKYSKMHHTNKNDSIFHHIYAYTDLHRHWHTYLLSLIKKLNNITNRKSIKSYSLYLCMCLLVFISFQKNKINRKRKSVV